MVGEKTGHVDYWLTVGRMCTSWVNQIGATNIMVNFIHRNAAERPNAGQLAGSESNNSQNASENITSPLANIELPRDPFHRRRLNMDSIASMQARSPEMRAALEALSQAEIEMIDEAVHPTIDPLKTIFTPFLSLPIGLLAMGSNISPAMQKFFATYDRPIAQEYLLRNPNVTLEARQTLARNPNLTDDRDAQLTLARDPDRNVRMALAKNPNLIDEAREILTKDEDMAVFILATCNNMVRRRA